MKDVKRIARAIDYCRANNYPITAVFNVIAEENFKVRIKVADNSEYNAEELIPKLQRYVETSLVAQAPLPMVETYLYSWGAYLDIVDPDNPDADLSGLVRDVTSEEKSESTTE